MSDPPAYIHGTSPEEQERLELMNGILNARWLAELELRAGERVLEMGAGTGIFAATLARAGARVVAIERDREQLAAARPRASDPAAAFDLRAGDAYDPPLSEDEWGGFDLVHARFLLEHLERPAEAVRVLVRAARPGGRVALLDDDHSLMRFWPSAGGMEELWPLYARQYERLGHDPNVGRKLVAHLVAAGARPVRTAMVFYGACAAEPGFRAVVRNLVEVVGGARAAVLAGSDWTQARFETALGDFQRWAERTDAALWYALPACVAVRP